MEKNQQPAEAEYDYEVDVFAGRPLVREYDSSFQIGNFVIDLDKKGKIVGIEVLNVSKLLNTSKVFLRNIVEGNIEITVNEEHIKVSISVKALVRNSQKSSMVSIERIKPDFMSPSELSLPIA